MENWKNKEIPKQEVLNCDCMDYMKTLPDNAFDLAVVDPPYGNGVNRTEGGGCANRYRFGGRWECYGKKKRMRGILPPIEHTLPSCLGYRKNR